MATDTSARFALGNRRGLPEELASIIISRIEGGDFKLGDVLPSEQALADMYQVSRTVVREALARLKYEGIIMSKRGSGPVVCGTSTTKGLKFDLNGEGIPSLGSFYEFRVLMEGEAAALAALRHTGEDAALLQEYLIQMSAAVANNTSGADPDYRFHCLIADAARNEYVSAFTKNLSTKLWMRVYSARDLSNRTRRQAQTVLEEHNAIFEAIVAREPHAAKKAAQMHILCSAMRQKIALDVRHLPWDAANVRCGEE